MAAAITAHAFVGKMDTEDIDLWYDKEKDKALNEYITGVENKKDRKEVEKLYKEKTRKLREKYVALYEKSLKLGFMKKISIKIKMFMDKLTEIYKE